MCNLTYFQQFLSAIDSMFGLNNERHALKYKGTYGGCCSEKG